MKAPRASGQLALAGLRSFEYDVADELGGFMCRNWVHKISLLTSSFAQPSGQL